jgi:hypothetical protein
MHYCLQNCPVWNSSTVSAQRFPTCQHATSTSIGMCVLCVAHIMHQRMAFLTMTLSAHGIPFDDADFLGSYAGTALGGGDGELDGFDAEPSHESAADSPTFASGVRLDQ